MVRGQVVLASALLLESVTALQLNTLFMPPKKHRCSSQLGFAPSTKQTLLEGTHRERVRQMAHKLWTAGKKCPGENGALKGIDEEQSLFLLKATELARAWESTVEGAQGSAAKQTDLFQFLKSHVNKMIKDAKTYVTTNTYTGVGNDTFENQCCQGQAAAAAPSAPETPDSDLNAQKDAPAAAATPVEPVSPPKKQDGCC
ncbi:unnamed protein product [Amoebophrya sp. A25]|nr:unnamed protein product [Amoebophrya sp. A25]|eukprot:GSA25T00021256001.1